MLLLAIKNDSLSGKSDLELYNLYRLGDVEALVSLFERYMKEFIPYAVSIIKNHALAPAEEAKDIIHNLIIFYYKRDLKKRKKLNDSLHVKSHFRTALKHKCIDKTRNKRSKDEELSKEFQVTEIRLSFMHYQRLQRIELNDKNLALWNCIKLALTELEFSIFELLTEDYDHKEIAKLLEIKYEKVRKKVYQIREKIKKQCLK